ncbi:cytochrome c [Geomicrobium sp. JSM 1781026]|uniref:c-type cytochrome n=1 Tax=Geomicrobium sp. JSM 1781026 TaxID=3344580 RepID=UPI0035BEC51D
MKPFKHVLAVSLLLVSAGCGDDREPVSDDDGGTTDQEAEVGDGYDGAEAFHLYEQNCMSCHGDIEGGEGGSAGPALQGYDAEQVLDAIFEGPGSMPANLLEGQEAESVANYIAEHG